MMSFVLAGTGFWASYQLKAWDELGRVRCVAVCDPNVARAKAFANHHGVGSAFDSVEEAVSVTTPDFVDITANVAAHSAVAAIGASKGLDVICQKPLADDLGVAQDMVDAADHAGTRLLVHENWRFQRPIRALARVLVDSDIGKVFRARVQYSCSFDVAANQPALAAADRFILLDIGPHIFDTIRYLFGDPATVYCRTSRISQRIRGEDVATAVLGWSSGLTVTVELSYSTIFKSDPFPQTRILVEAENGTARLERDYRVVVETTRQSIVTEHPPHRYDWTVDPYSLVQDSIVACNEHLLDALQGRRMAETEGVDNLRTLSLVFAAYDSSASGSVVEVTYP